MIRQPPLCGKNGNVGYAALHQNKPHSLPRYNVLLRRNCRVFFKTRRNQPLRNSGEQKGGQEQYKRRIPKQRHRISPKRFFYKYSMVLDRHVVFCLLLNEMLGRCQKRADCNDMSKQRLTGIFNLFFTGYSNCSHNFQVLY